MQVDRDRPSAVADPPEDAPPERAAPLGHPALAVDPKGHAADRRAGLEQRPDRVATVRSVRLGREPLDRVTRVRAVDPLVRVRPQPELEIEAAGHRRLGHEAQHP